MTSINSKVFGLTRPGFEHAGLRLEPTTFGFPDLPKLIRPLDGLWLKKHAPSFISDIMIVAGDTKSKQEWLSDTLPLISLPISVRFDLDCYV